MAYDATIDRLPLSALFDLKGKGEALAEWSKGTLPALPQAPNSLSRADGMALCFIGPDHWILRADAEHEAQLEAALNLSQSPPEISIVTISDTLTFFRIAGPDADQIMPIGCPLDLHISKFGPDAVSFTEFFGLKALVMRCEGGFDCGVEQSFGDMIADYLVRAMA
ncbi:MAG: sarcosine oxidase subunit gamma [Ruegeria sp.]|uniref:sarcosine oxidase subunit gamma n=1 Tax=Ruegeria sp. TaxID=1879320 RepID=UPI00349E94FF